jgi:hypothetical protein
MKKFFVVFTAFAFVMAMGLPAMADVSVLGTIDKTKTKTVTETVNIDKAHYVGVKQVVKPSSSAEAQALKNDVNQGNVITEREIPAVPEGSPEYTINPITGEYFEVPGTSSPGVAAVPLTKTAAIDAGALDAAAGIVNVNQSPGSINNQGNGAAISYSATAAPIVEITDGSEGETRFVGGAFLHAESSAELINGGTDAGNSVDAIGSTRTNTIDGALNGVKGIVGVNQSAGNMNNQNNAVSMSVGAGIAALSEADLGLCNSGNISSETGTVTTDTLTGAALASAAGVIGINQSSGCMNNQANVVAACVLVHP